MDTEAVVDTAAEKITEATSMLKRAVTGLTGKEELAELKRKAASMSNRVTTHPKFKSTIKEVFEMADADGSGKVDSTECYSMVLRLYLYIAAWVTIYDVPTRAQVDELYHKMDANGDGELDFEEFEVMAVILCESISGRVTTQLVMQFVISPVVALLIICILVNFVFVGPVASILTTIIPGFLITWVFNETIGVMVITILSNVILMPIMLSLWDRMTLSREHSKKEA